MTRNVMIYPVNCIIDINHYLITAGSRLLHLAVSKNEYAGMINVEMGPSGERAKSNGIVDANPCGKAGARWHAIANQKIWRA